MSEKETENDIVAANVTPKGDNLLKWYYIFAMFLFVNLCGVGYAYYYKFYRNKNNSQSAESANSKVIVLPPDTIYVDNIDDENTTDAADANQDAESEQVAEVKPVSHVERARQLSFSVRPTENAANKNGSSDNTSSEIAKADADNTNKVASIVESNKAPLPKSTMKVEHESHTYMISCGMFKDKENAVKLLTELKQKGISSEMVASNHFEKLPPSYILVLGGKELSSASAYQICAELKKKGIDCSVQDGGKYSWR